MEILSIDKEVFINVRQKTPKMASLPSPQSTFDNFLYDPISEGTKKLYSELSQTWISSGSCTEYVKQATL